MKPLAKMFIDRCEIMQISLRLCCRHMHALAGMYMFESVVDTVDDNCMFSSNRLNRGANRHGRMS